MEKTLTVEMVPLLVLVVQMENFQLLDQHQKMTVHMVMIFATRLSCFLYFKNNHLNSLMGTFETVHEILNDSFLYNKLQFPNFIVYRLGELAIYRRVVGAWFGHG